MPKACLWECSSAACCAFLFSHPCKLFKVNWTLAKAFFFFFYYSFFFPPLFYFPWFYKKHLTTGGSCCSPRWHPAGLRPCGTRDPQGPPSTLGAVSPHQGVWGAPQPQGGGATLTHHSCPSTTEPRISVATTGTGGVGCAVWDPLCGMCCAPHSGSSTPESQQEGRSCGGGTAHGTAGTHPRGLCCASRGKPGGCRGKRGPP